MFGFRSVNVFVSIFKDSCFIINLAGDEETITTCTTTSAFKSRAVLRFLFSEFVFIFPYNTRFLIYT